MKVKKAIFHFFILVPLIVLAFASFPKAVLAQTQACHDATGLPIPCPDSGDNKPGKKNHPTEVIPSPTSTSTPEPTATLPAKPLTSGGPGPSQSDNLLPAVQNPGQGGSTLNMPGPLGMLIALLIIIVCCVGGFFFIRSIRKAGENIPFEDDGVYKNKHKPGAFEVEDYSFDVEKPSTIGSATSGAGAGKRTFKAFHINKPTDNANSTNSNSSSDQDYARKPP